MAQLIPPFLANAFERMGSGNKSLEQIAINTGSTAASVSVGGDLYEKMDELIKALKSPGKGGGKVSIKEALVLRITASALEPIGLGLGIIIDALERAPDGKELKLKMEALTNGLLALGDVGMSILKFAATMILATPLLLVAGVAALIWVPMLRAMIWGLMWATEKLDKKALKKILVLGQVGKALLVLSASLVLMSLLAPYILKGMLVAGAILLGFGLLSMLLEKMKIGKSLGKMAKMLKTLSVALLGLSVGLILMGLLTEPILYGLATASLIILTLAGVFWLLDKMQVDKAMRKTSKALIFAAGAILSVSVSLVLSSLIVSTLGWDEVGKVLLLVGAVALAFSVIDKIMGKSMKKGAIGLIFAAGAILAIAVAIFVAKLLIGPVDTDNILETFAVLAVVGAVAIVFGLAGLAESFIKKGAIAMMFAGGALIVIAIGIWAMLKAVKGAEWKEIGMVGAVILGVGVVMGLAGLVAPQIALGSLAMMLAGVSMVVISFGTSKMLGALKDTGWEGIGMMGAVIGGLALAMAGAGVASPFIILGSVAMLIAAGALILIGKGIEYLNKIDLESAFKPRGLFGDSGQKTKGFLGIGGGRVMTNMEVIFEAIANSFSLGPFQIAALYAASPALILAGLSLISIGEGLQRFQKVADNTDMVALGINVGLVTNVLADAFAAIGKKFPGGSATLFSSGSLVAQGISSVRGMGDALTGIAVGMQNMANLKFPTKFDKEGNPIEFETMDSDAPIRVATNTAMIVNALSTTFGDLGKKYPRAKQGFLDALVNGKAQNPVELGIASVSGMGGALTGIATGFQNMANLKFPLAYDKEGKPTKFAEVEDLPAAALDVASNTRLIVTSLSETFADIGKGKTSSWWQGATDYEKGVEVVTGLGTPLKNLAEGVKNMADMKFADGYDAEGKATGWTSLADMTPEALKDKIAKNTEILITALTDVFVVVGGGKTKTSSWWQGATKFEKGIEVVNLIADPYKKLGESIKTIIEIVGKADIDSFAGKVSKIIGIFTSIEGGDSVLNTKKILVNAIGHSFEKMGKAVPLMLKSIDAMKPDNSKMFSNMFIGPVKKGAEIESYNGQKILWNAIGHSLTQGGESMPKITESINSLDLSKLTETRMMFEALGVLSKGGEPSDILAAMGESLESALQNLADMLQEFKQTVGEGGEQSNSLMNKMVDTVKSIAPASGSNKSAAAQPAPQLPSKMTVTLDQKSINAIKQNTSLGGGRS